MRPNILLNGHVHTDYKTDEPIDKALRLGFRSIEVDIFLIWKTLYLGHTFPSFFPKKTLKKDYFERLALILEKNEGRIYPHFDGVFYLFIDVKTPATSTFLALQELVKSYPIFCQNPHFRLVWTGKQNVELFMTDQTGAFCLDGRIEHLDQPLSLHDMPLVSLDFRKITKWRGKGKLAQADLDNIKKLIQKAHANGQMIRFWAAPDQEIAWKILHELGVDFINTDRLRDLKRFFRTNV